MWWFEGPMYPTCRNQSQHSLGYLTNNWVDVELFWKLFCLLKGWFGYGFAKEVLGFYYFEMSFWKNLEEKAYFHLFLKVFSKKRGGKCNYFLKEFCFEREENKKAFGYFCFWKGMNMFQFFHFFYLVLKTRP